MLQLDIYDKAGQNVGQIDLSSDVFEVPVNENHLHMAVVRQLANKRAGTASTKTRGEVSGGGKKPWKQKGTGRARHGSIRSPIWRGGGITFGPRPRDYEISMPRKMRRLALKEALSSKVMDNAFKVVDSLSVEGYSTKAFMEIMKGLNVSGKTLFVLKDASDEVVRSGRNIKGVRIVKPQGINVYDLLVFDTVVFDKAAVQQVEEVLS